MNGPMPSLKPQPNQQAAVLLLCEDEKAANLDRRALRQAGYGHARVMTSGIEAARLLAGMDRQPDGYMPEIVVCLNQLADMDGEQFCAIVRQHPLLSGLPILLILPNANEAEQLRALGCGASVMLGRPYSVDVLKKNMAQLAAAVPSQRSLRKAAQEADTRAFDEALATYGVLLRSERGPEDYFKVGMRSLSENNWQLAIAAFERALRDAQIKAEAELGIAAAFKGKGDMPSARAWLARSADSFIQARRWNRARSAYARLLQNDPSARNPFLAEAHKLIHQHEYDEAATALVYSLGFISKKNAGERYARVCMAADEPEAMLAVLELKLNADGRGQYGFLNEEIRANLEVMARQKADRQRQQSAERKLQLARNLGLAPERRTPSKTEAAASLKNFGQEKPELREEKTVTDFGRPPVSDADWEQEEDSEDEGPEPLEKDDGLSTKPGRLNELLSVMKMTWRLSRKSRKNSK